ncbi:MAG: acyclic terpene utilization AtuA family protein [Myxococcota bacterium]|nr:acyclic terpene utilization AtuA family protein [Myxococcota bacterium]
MADPIRIANCSGFFGDRLSAAREMVEDGPIDVLTGDWLAELTMLILARTRLKRPGGGYARTFVTQMKQVMGTCLERGIKVVSNAGGLDPDGCAAAVAEVAGELGLQPKIAYVRGDDLLPRMDELIAADQLTHFETGEPIKDASAFLTANAYFGCWGIVDALNDGADIVITGRTTDAAIVCGPAAWHHGWSRTDWNPLAGAVAAGHVIECGTQATGGNYSFFTEVPGMARVGFPWAEIAEDGATVFGKHEGTGGEVSIGTITSQLLYEIGGPEYFGPDVTTRFDTIQLDQQGPDRVCMSGVQGEPPPATLKVCINRPGGFRQDLNVCLTGIDIEAKARLVEEAFWAACPFGPDDFAAVKTRLVRTDKADPESNEEATAFFKISLKDPDEKKVGRATSNAMIELALASIPGFTSVGGGPGGGRAFGVYEPANVPAAIVPQEVVMLGGETREISSVIPDAPAEVTLPAEPAATVPGDKTHRAPLGSVVGARSGDKGGNANLGVFARNDATWAWLDGFLTTETLRTLLPEAAELKIDRHRLPGIRSLNFVLHGLLEEGVAASTRQDGQAKSLGEWLRARVVEIPGGLSS